MESYIQYDKGFHARFLSMEFFDKRIDKGLAARLETLAQSPFERITYTEAVKLLHVLLLLMVPLEMVVLVEELMEETVLLVVIVILVAQALVKQVLQDILLAVKFTEMFNWFHFQEALVLVVEVENPMEVLMMEEVEEVQAVVPCFCILWVTSQFLMVH